MQNPIPRTGFFATPTSYQQLIDYIGQMSGPERALAMTIAHMSLNLAHQMVQQQQREVA
jgi:hypothetical protein